MPLPKSSSPQTSQPTASVRHPAWEQTGCVCTRGMHCHAPFSLRHLSVPLTQLILCCAHAGVRLPVRSTPLSPNGLPGSDTGLYRADGWQVGGDGVKPCLQSCHSSQAMRPSLFLRCAERRTDGHARSPCGGGAIAHDSHVCHTRHCCGGS